MTAKKTASESKNPFVSYFTGAFEEFGKVTWPTKEQAALLTGIVVATSLVCALALGLFDFGLNSLYQLVLEKLSS
jgi:preprotein translocase SecE subunit